MKWFDFTDLNFLIFFIISICVILLILFLLLSNIYLFKKQEDHSLKIDEELNSIRIYSIDVERNKVIYFNRSNIKKKISCDLMTFYHKFHANDMPKVKEWIDNIMEGKNVPTFINVDVTDKKSLHLTFVMLRLLSFNKNSKIIHIESHMMRYIAPSNAVKNGKKRSGLSGNVAFEQMTKYIKNSKSIKGFTFGVGFFSIKQLAFVNDEAETLMYTNLKNRLYSYLYVGSNHPRQIYEESQKMFIISDLYISKKEDAYRLANSIARDLQQTIAINCYGPYVKFCIGIVENSQFFQNYHAMVKHAKETVLVSEQNNRIVAFYEKSNVPEINEGLHAEEIAKIINSNNLRYLFRPIINVKEKNVLGYFEYVKAYGTPYSNYSELNKVAAKFNKNADLFAVIAKNVIPKFSLENNDIHSRLFFEVSIFDLQHVEEILPQVYHIERTKVVLTFNEQEVNLNAANIDFLFESLRKLHLLGFEIALSLVDKNLLLDQTFYSCFDYFIVGAIMTEEIKYDGRIRLSVRTLVESLLKFHRPIIATGLDSWAAIELIIKSGVSYVSSEVISPANEMVLPLDRKKLQKLASYDTTVR